MKYWLFGGVLFLGAIDVLGLAYAWYRVTTTTYTWGEELETIAFVDGVAVLVVALLVVAYACFVKAVGD